MLRLPISCFIPLLFISFSNVYAQGPADKEHQQKADLGNGYFQNAVLPGDYPDPSVVKVGDDYYLTHSSFEYYPGLLIWHSRDLVSWQPVTHALHTYVGSVWAPDLVFYKNKYYIYFPANRKNWVVTADAPAGPWSEPVELNVEGIDPGHIVGEDGKRYLYVSGGNFVQLSEDGLRVTSEAKHVYNGWPIPDSLGVECFCLESPKMSFRNGYYYQTVAEGGTAGPATSHMVVSARATAVGGPWINSPYNPIIHTGTADEKWWSKGHGSLVDDANGQTWILYHGYEKNFHTLGRQMLMQPLEWTKDHWFREPDGFDVAQPIKKPAGKTLPHGMALSDDFNSSAPGLQWQFYKQPAWDRVSCENGKLLLSARGTSLKETSPLLCMPANHHYVLETQLDIEPGATAGITLFYDEKAHCAIAMDEESMYVIRQERTYRFRKKQPGKTAFLKLENDDNNIFFWYSADGNEWIRLDKSINIAGFNHNTFGGFLSVRAGLFCTGSGKASFDFFQYTGID